MQGLAPTYGVQQLLTTTEVLPTLPPYKEAHMAPTYTVQ